MKTCLCCSGDSLQTVLDLGVQPLANDYDGVAGMHPLTVLRCLACGHMQLSEVIAPDIMFSTYAYVSGTTETLQKHFHDLALRYGRGRTLDIACNDGTLMRAMEVRGCDAWGIDPASNFAAPKVVTGYFPGARPEGLFDVVTACNVLGHVQDPRGFLLAARGLMRGELIVEVPDCAALPWDTVYHEHVSYFTMRSLTTLMKSCELAIKEIYRVEAQGGSIRTVAVGDGATADSGLVGANDGFLIPASSVPMRADIGFGAAAKGTVFLNHTKTKLDYIVDENSLKHGKYVPGTRIPIVPPDKLWEDQRSLTILVLAWNFLPEITRKIRARRGNRDKIIVRPGL